MAVFGGFSNIAKVPELRRRILFSLAVLAIYRVGVFITIPGVDRSVMKQVVSNQGGVLGLFNMSSGGLRAFSGVTVGLVGSMLSVHVSLALAAGAFMLIALAMLARLPSATKVA